MMEYCQTKIGWGTTEKWNTNKMYPTKEEILKIKPPINEETINIVKNWRKVFMHRWKYYTIKQKIETLNKLIYCVQVMENTGLPPAKTKAAKQYKYSKKKKTIYYDNKNPSIISSLHETAHHLFGPDELLACRWSIHLFKECFPTAYKQLHWVNHQLKK